MELTSKCYRVAGHVFKMTLPASEKLWDAIGPQYSPFEIPEKEAGDPLFHIEFTESLPQGRLECIYDQPTQDGETVVKLYRQDGADWYFETTPDHRKPTTAFIWASSDFKQVRLSLATRRVSDAVFGINNAAMLVFAFATACLGTLEMHASVIENGGKAYLFLGKSGTGKSTHSSLWLKYVEGSTLMNDDNPVVRVWPDGRITAYGTPWSGKTPCYKNIEAPVGAYVQIRQCPQNKIARCSVLEAYSYLFSSISGIKDDSSSMADGLNDTISAVLTDIPVYILDCRPDEEAAALSSSTIRK